MRRRFTRRTVLGGIAVVASLAAFTAPSAAQTLRLGTATEGGVWYILGNGFAQVISAELKSPVTPITTAGSLENLRRLASGSDLQLGFVVATSLNTVLKDGTVKPQNVRVIGAGHGNYTQVVVRRGSGITSWKEAFKPGRSVGVGEPGSAAFEMARGAIESQGVTVDQVKAARLGHQAQADALKNRSIEVMVVSPGIPTGAVADVINTADGLLLSATEADVKATIAKVPYMDRGVIPANTYDKHPNDIVTVVLPSLLFVAAGLPEETVYRITKSVYENTDRLAKVHVNGREWTPKSALASREFLTKSGFDYHPGAIRYFKEKGVW